MISPRRLAATLAITAGLAATPLVTASPALAELPCAWGDVTSSAWNYPLDGVACVVLETTTGIRLVGVTNVQPGWTYVVKSAGGTLASDNNKVEIRFTNASTKQDLTFRYEPGKTVIR